MSSVIVDTPPLVSVIVITYNSSRYVEETLESIKAQTYRNIELIISDDGSSDHTLDICREWVKSNSTRFSGIKIMETAENTGIPGNCNRGLRQASGKWVKFIAGDDRLLENCISDNVTWCTEHPGTTFLFSEARKMDEQGNFLSKDFQAYTSEKRGWRHRFFDLPQKEQLLVYARETLFLETSTAFYNREILIQSGGFDERLRIFEDIPVYLKLLSSGYRLSFMPVFTIVYRISPDSISKKKEAGLDRKRLQEFAYIFDTYRRPHLSWFNRKDLSALVEAWLDFTYALKYKLPGARFIKKIFRWGQ